MASFRAATGLAFFESGDGHVMLSTLDRDLQVVLRKTDLDEVLLSDLTIDQFSASI